VEFTLSKSHERKDKQVVASLKAQRLFLYPANRKGRKLSVAEINVVKLAEINPPKGEEAIEWIILTSLPINTLKEAPQLGEMIDMIASLGCYLGRKHDGPPGPKTLWLGFQRMADFALAWKLFRPDE